MVSRSTLLHLRLPFSYFLLPVYLLAVLVSEHVVLWNAVIIFVVLHFFIYTASNGFNSYFDRDEESIGALKHPPKVTSDLLWVSLALDAVAIVLAYFVHPMFALSCFIYGLASKAYSWDKIRLKRFPVIGWLLTGLGVGPMAFLMVVLFVSHANFDLLNPRYLMPALIVGAFLLGFYPLTQVYQHREDSRRGDRTMSILVGVKGTFVLAAPLLAGSLTGLGFYIARYYKFEALAVYIILQLPALFYFIRWAMAVFKDSSKADFDHAFRMSVIATSGLNIFCVIALLAFRN